MGTHAAQFETQFEIVKETTYGTTPGSGWKVLQCTDEPEINISTEANELPIVSGGTSEPQAEQFVQGRSPNSARWAGRLESHRFKLALSSMFQDNAWAGVTPNWIDTFAPFASYPTSLFGYSLQKVYGASSADALRLAGAICNRWRISSQSGAGPVLDTEWRGKSGSKVATVTPSSTKLPTNPVYAHTAVDAGNSGAFSINSVHMSPVRYEITAEMPNIGAFYGSAQNPDEVGLSNVKLTASMTVSAKNKGMALITDMLAGTWRPFSWSLGAGTTLMSLACDCFLLSMEPGVEDGFEVMTYNLALAKSTTSVLFTVHGAAQFAP